MLVSNLGGSGNGEKLMVNVRLRELCIRLENVQSFRPPQGMIRPNGPSVFQPCSVHMCGDMPLTA